jgi:hypothetical protein
MGREFSGSFAKWETSPLPIRARGRIPSAGRRNYTQISRNTGDNRRRRRRSIQLKQIREILPDRGVELTEDAK